jgi:hypothetical protein
LKTLSFSHLIFVSSIKIHQLWSSFFELAWQITQKKYIKSLMFIR